MDGLQWALAPDSQNAQTQGVGPGADMCCSPLRQASYDAPFDGRYPTGDQAMRLGRYKLGLKGHFNSTASIASGQ